MIINKKSTTQIKVKVVPNAKQTQLVGRQGDFIKIRIAAVPDHNKANTELVRFLSKNYNINKSDIEIIRGNKNHRKILLVPVKQGNVINKIS
ncbi:MAG: DUF167 domain-containing protein [Candidatus Kerfeldbacteria bacterium]